MSYRGTQQFGGKCKRGHDLSDERNCIACLLKKGLLSCRICGNARTRQDYYKHGRGQDRGAYRRGNKPFCKRGHQLTVGNMLKNRQCRICACNYMTIRRKIRNRNRVEYIDPIILYGRDKGICGICKAPVHVNQFHIDHIKPLSKGGEHSYRNTQIAHPSCNIRKSDKTSNWQIKTVT